MVNWYYFSLCGCMSILNHTSVLGRVYKYGGIQLGLQRFGRQVKEHFRKNPVCLAKALQDKVWMQRVTTKEVSC